MSPYKAAELLSLNIDNKRQIKEFQPDWTNSKRLSLQTSFSTKTSHMQPSTHSVHKTRLFLQIWSESGSIFLSLLSYLALLHHISLGHWQRLDVSVTLVLTCLCMQNRSSDIIISFSVFRKAANGWRLRLWSFYHY